MFGNDRKLRAAMILALVDLNQRLTALEPTDEQETELENIFNTVRGIGSGMYSLQDRTYNLERLITTLVQGFSAVTKNVQEVKENTDSTGYYQRRSGQQVDKLAAKIDRLIERQATVEQLLDAVRVYATERTVRDEQAAKPGGTENGGSV
jgi:prefoldin subunit 5